jgi:hypothetical protein
LIFERKGQAKLLAWPFLFAAPGLNTHVSTPVLCSRGSLSAVS